MQSFTSADPSRTWTLRQVIAHNTIGGRGPLIVGTAAEIADEMLDWVNATDVDGFNLSYALMPETYADFIDLVVPERQRRGCYRSAYVPATLRAKFQGGDTLRASHTGAAFRRLAPNRHDPAPT